jgi:hypothetical protein
LITGAVQIVLQGAFAAIQNRFGLDRHARAIKCIIDFQAALVEAHIGNAAGFGDFSGILALLRLG